MADVLDRLKAGSVTVDEIVARMIADAVAGLDPASSAYPDAIPGTILNDVYGAVSLELDRVYDRIHTELPATGIPTLTSGEWLDQWAYAVGLERKDEVRATGSVTFTTGATAPEVNIGTGAEVSTEAPTDDEDELVFVTMAPAVIPAGGGAVEVAVEALNAGAMGNVAANTVTVPQTIVAHLESVTNPAAITGGADVEADEALQDRVRRKLAGVTGPGNIADYENWALEEPGVGFVTVQPNWDGPGSVRVVITDTNNDPVAGALIDRLQERLDPGLTGEGFGQAPIGAVVTVATPVTHLVDVAATIVPEPGYSVDGAGGTQSLEADISAALSRYVNRLSPGADVIHNKVLSAIIDVTGVADADVTTPAGNEVIAANEVAALDDLALT